MRHTGLLADGTYVEDALVHDGTVGGREDNNNNTRLILPDVDASPGG